MDKIPVIYSTDDVWIAELKDGNTIKKTRHSSRIKAIISFFHYHKGIRMFAIVPLPFPVKGVNNGDNDSNLSKNKLETKGVS